MIRMAERMNRQTLRSDRGDVPAWPVVVIIMLMVVSIVGSETLLHHLSAAHALLLFAEIMGGLIVIIGLALGGVVIGEWIQTRRRRTVDWAMGPVVRELMDVDQLKDDELTQWRQCQRKGITVEQARQWARDGLPYPLLLASPRLPVERRSVRALARVMADAGAWDGHDRRRLVDLIGFHIELTGGTYPVLGRWLAFPQDTVRARVSSAVTHADTNPDPYFIVATSRVAAAAEAVLYELEDEHGIKGYRQQSYFYRPARPVHPSWLAHA